MKEKQRKKFHWWYIPLGIVLVLVLTAGGLVLWMHSMLPWPNMVAMTSNFQICLLYTSPSPRDRTRSRMPSSA